MTDNIVSVPVVGDWRTGLQMTANAKLAAIEHSKALSPLAGRIAWSGTVLPNGLGNGSPQCHMSGESKGTWVNDGLYLLVQGDYRYRAGELSGSFWKFDFLIGYEPLGKQYRKLLADNVGVVIKECTLVGSRLIVDFPKGARIESGGRTILFRQTYDWAEEGKVRNAFEVRIDDGDWFLTADLQGVRLDS
jgi:hypothetical protein